MPKMAHAGEDHRDAMFIGGGDDLVGLDEAANAGAKSVIQPGGSIKDDEVIAAANEHGIAMIFTGMRHFRH